MVNKCLAADSSRFTQIYSHWFPINQQAVVKNILGAMVNPASADGTGSTTLAQITVTNEDPFNLCETRSNVAYTSNARPGDRHNDPTPIEMHFCQTATINSFALPALSAVSCANLDTFVSTKMQTLGGYTLVHELAHVKEISNAAIAPLKIAIPGQPSSTCEYAQDFIYGPQSCQTLADPPAPANPNNALANADNYGWFVTVCTRLSLSYSFYND